MGEENIHASGRIRTRNPRKRTAADPLLRLHGRWDRLHTVLETRFLVETAEDKINVINPLKTKRICFI
jgi:hypothetical protein